MKASLLNIFLVSALCSVGSTSLATAAPAVAAAKETAVTITPAEVNAAQQAWCDALVAIGKNHEAGGDA